MSVNVTILVGTMSGTAELVADEILDELEKLGHTAEVLDMDGLDHKVFGRPGVFLICTATYGQGDVPDNAVKLYDDLREGRPDLTGLVYGVFGLGDKTYTATFNLGGRQFDEILTELNGRRIGERFAHNASGGSFPEEDAVEWVQDWIAKVEAAVG